VKIVPVGEHVWGEAVLCCGDRLASGILWSLQDQHIGITPRLAAQLAVVIGGSHRDAGPVWERLFESLVASLDLTSAPGRFGLNPTFNRMYTVLGVAGPLIRKECAAMGRTYLLSRDAHHSPVTKSEYEQYDKALEAGLISAAQNLPLERLGFEIAHLLSSASRESPLDVTAKTALPSIDRAAAALIQDQASSIPRSRWVPRRPPTPDFAPKNRRSPGPNEDAIEGIVKTTREAHISSMIQSEFLNPPALMADRLTQSGFLIHDRRPHREKLRDVLVACMMPYETRQLASSAFLKACWFECMAQLGILLTNYKLFRTEFRWIEGDRFGRVRDTSLFLDQISSAGAGLIMSDAVRRWYLAALKWLPGYIDERAPFRPIGGDVQRPDRWAVSAWQNQQDRQRWIETEESAGAGAGAGAVPASRFSSVHVMVILPSTEQGAPGGESILLGQLQVELGLGRSARRNSSITYAPPSVGNDAWIFCPRNAPRINLQNQLSDNPVAVSGMLQRAWLDQLIQEVWSE
jgi:hypothetical protein